MAGKFHLYPETIGGDKEVWRALERGAKRGRKKRKGRKERREDKGKRGGGRTDKPYEQVPAIFYFATSSNKS